MLEAECTRCGETFIPHSVDPEDIIHGETAEGEPCGGIGVIQGRWVSLDEAGKSLAKKWENFQRLMPFEKHGQEEPDCNDPTCEYHHPRILDDPSEN